MKLKTRMLGLSAAAVMATSLVAGAAYAGPPVVDQTEDTLYNSPQFAEVGNCNYLLIGTAKSTDGTGLGATLKPITISLKNYPLASGNFGSCDVQTRTGASASTLNITSGSAKLTSANSSCHSEPRLIDTTDDQVNNPATPNPAHAAYRAAVRPLSGGIKLSFGATTLQGYVRTVGFDTDASVVTWLTGIVTKGEMVGASLGGSNWFTPVAKSKANVAGYLGDAAFSGDTLLGPDAKPIAPGYGTSTAYSSGVALGCLAGPPLTADLRSLAVAGGPESAGAVHTDPLLGAPASGLKILL